MAIKYMTRDEAEGMTGAGATLTDGPEPRAKPAALAAGQVWERTVGSTTERRTISRPDAQIGGRWFCEEMPESDRWIDEWAMLTMPGWTYLGTREEVAARVPAMGMSRAPLGTMTPGAIRAAALGACEKAFANPERWEAEPVPVVRDMLGSSADAWLDAIAEQWYGVKRSAGETDDALRARCIARRDALAPPKTSPLAALRAEIDRIIAADSGPFAHARAAALRSYGERPRPVNLDALTHASLIAGYLRQYEERRGGATRPNPDAYGAAEGWVGSDALATYERERSRSDLYARPLSRRGSR